MCIPSKSARVFAVCLCTLLPRGAAAEVFSDLLECAALFDVLDVSQMEDPEAFRDELDAASVLFASIFRSFHGERLTAQRRMFYREAWQSKPSTEDAATELAETLRHCERQAELRGVPIGIAEQRLQDEDERPD